MRKVITASEGRVLTDGKIFAKEIYLAEGADASSFYEITEEEYERLMANEETE